MTKGTKIFRIIISILLGITMLVSAFFTLVFLLHIDRNIIGASQGVFVAGVEITEHNEDDVLGDGTVFYDSYNHVLTFQNAEIEYDESLVYSKVDLMIQLIGENKFVLSGETATAIHISDYLLRKDLSVFGDGSLTIEFKGSYENATGIQAKNIRIESDITLIMPDCANISNGIYSDASMVVSSGATVTVENGTAVYSTAVKARNNMDIERGSALNVSARPGSVEICRGLTVGGALVVWEDAKLNVSVDDETAKLAECINVAGLFDIKDNAEVTASSKKSHAIACYGAMELKPGADVSASTAGEGVDLLCYGVIVNHGATVNGEVEALCGIHNK